MIERRVRRSNFSCQALGYFLESVRKKCGLKAVALTDDDGLFIAGSAEGEIDLEWMGAVGAASKRQRVEWEHQTLDVGSVPVNGGLLYLTSLGRARPTLDVAAGIDRILISNEAQLN